MNNRLFHYLYFILYFMSCTPIVRNELPPVLTTTKVSNITQNTALCGGNITTDAGTSVIARGVCWSTKSNPTIADSITTDSIGIGSFRSAIKGLTAGITYFVRAYATNHAGTEYGSVYSFTTPLYICFNSNLSYGSAKDIDGNIYKTITIGTQTWMAENLRTTKYRNGDTIPIITDNITWANLTTGACCNFNNEYANVPKYGKLYNFYAVTDPRSIAPTGWHVSTDAEWIILTTFLGGESGAGGKLKEVGTFNWFSPNISATNESGFSALPGGKRYQGYGRFYYSGDNGYWWSSSNDSDPYAWSRSLDAADSSVGRWIDYKQDGFSVRCIKD